MNTGAIINLRHRRLRRSQDAVSETMAREGQYCNHEPDHRALAYGALESKRRPGFQRIQVSAFLRVGPSKADFLSRQVHRR